MAVAEGITQTYVRRGRGSSSSNPVAHDDTNLPLPGEPSYDDDGNVISHIEEEDESIATLARILKSRGGKLIVDDEEEEEEEEEEAEQEEAEAEAVQTETNEAAEKPAEAKALGPLPKSITDEATDALADLLSKVKIESKSS